MENVASAAFKLFLEKFFGKILIAQSVHILASDNVYVTNCLSWKRPKTFR